MSDLAALNRTVQLSSAANDFTLVAKAIAASRGNWNEMQKLAGSTPSPRAREVIKAGVAASTMSNSAALVPYKELAAGFFGSLGQFSAFSKIYNAGDFTRVPLRTSISVLTTAPVGYSESELAAKPLSSADFTTAVLDSAKVTSIVIITDELARSASQASLLMLGTELRRAAGIAVDAKFLALMATTAGATTAGTTGVTSTAIFADLLARLDAMTIGADSRLWLIVGPKLYKTLSLAQGAGGYIMQSGKIGMVNVAASDAATTTATLIDAKGIAAELDYVTLDSTREASLVLDDNPTSGPQSLVSLWEANLTGLKCEIAFGAVAMRSSSITTITGYSA